MAIVYYTPGDSKNAVWKLPRPLKLNTNRSGNFHTGRALSRAMLAIKSPNRSKHGHASTKAQPSGRQLIFQKFVMFLALYNRFTKFNHTSHAVQAWWPNSHRHDKVRIDVPKWFVNVGTYALHSNYCQGTLKWDISFWVQISVFCQAYSKFRSPMKNLFTTHLILWF